MTAMPGLLLALRRNNQSFLQLAETRLGDLQRAGEVGAGESP